jgi:hypothetical protein
VVVPRRPLISGSWRRSSGRPPKRIVRLWLSLDPPM